MMPIAEPHAFRPSPYSRNGACSDCGVYEEEGLHTAEDGEYPDPRVGNPGPAVIGQRCPWCGALVTDGDHAKGCGD